MLMLFWLLLYLEVEHNGTFVLIVGCTYAFISKLSYFLQLKDLFQKCFSNSLFEMLSNMLSKAEYQAYCLTKFALIIIQGTWTDKISFLVILSLIAIILYAQISFLLLGYKRLPQTRKVLRIIAIKTKEAWVVVHVCRCSRYLISNPV